MQVIANQAVRINAAVLGMVLISSLAWAKPAHATDVLIESGALVIRDGSDARNILDVRPIGLGYEIYDEAGGLVPGPGCVAGSPQLVQCLGFVAAVRVDSGAGNDLVGLWDVAVPVTATGGAGDDLLEGGSGPDALSGGEGRDALVGYNGDDRLAGNNDDDFLEGRNGADTLDGGAGPDILEGGKGSRDTLLGGVGKDLLRGGGGGDVLDGQAGNDVMIGGGGADSVETGTGADRVFGADGRRDTVDCRAGDLVRADHNERPAACGKMSASVKVPKAWPPRPAASAARLRRVNPQIRARLRRRCNATRVTVTVIEPSERKRHIVFRTYDSHRQRLKTFKRDVTTKFARTFEDPKPRKAACFVRADFH
jgi:hypothetical protein